jgi:hypothetical protein
VAVAVRCRALTAGGKIGGISPPVEGKLLPKDAPMPLIDTARGNAERCAENFEPAAARVRAPRQAAGRRRVAAATDPGDAPSPTRAGSSPAELLRLRRAGRHRARHRFRQESGGPERPMLVTASETKFSPLRR